MKRAASLFLLATAALWSIAAGIGISNGFGLLREALGTRESLVLGTLCAGPVWLSWLSVWSVSIPAKVIRLCALLYLAILFVALGPWIAQTIVFEQLKPFQSVGIFLGNLFLFRVPFVMAFIAMFVLGAWVWNDARRWRQHRTQITEQDKARFAEG